MQGGITAGTVLAVLVPVLIALLCYASYQRDKDRDYASFTLPRLHHRRAPAPRVSISRPIGPVKNVDDYSPVTHKKVFSDSPPPQKLMSEAPLGRADSFSSADDSSSDLPETPSSRRSRSDSDSYTYPGHAPALDAIGCRPMRIPKTFDGDYDTHEPLDDKPVVFPNVLWDLDDLDYEPHLESKV